MKKLVKRLSMTVVASAMALLTACGGGAPASNSNASSGGEAPKTQEAAAPKSGGNQQLTIATASTTGAFYPIGGAMAKILSDNLAGMNFTAEATAGSVENARLLGDKNADFAFLGADTSYDAFNGLGKFKEGKKDVLGMFVLYTQPLHFVVNADSPIKTIEDLKGKKVAVGAPGSGTESKAKIVLEEFGLDYKTIKAEFLDFAEGANGLKDGNVDAVVLSVGAPGAAILDLATSHKIRLLSFSDEQISNFLDKYPYFNKAIIAKGTYTGVEEDVTTFGSPSEFLVRADMDEETVYNVTKIIFDNLDALKASHNSVKDFTVENAIPVSIPLHPGAEKFFKEKGILK